VLCADYAIRKLHTTTLAGKPYGSMCLQGPGVYRRNADVNNTPGPIRTRGQRAFAVNLPVPLPNFRVVPHLPKAAFASADLFQRQLPSGRTL